MLLDETRIKAFNDLPTQTKSLLTKTYNNLMKTCLKPTKKTKGKSGESFKKFDPDIQEQASDPEEDSEEEAKSDSEVA